MPPLEAGTTRLSCFNVRWRSFHSSKVQSVQSVFIEKELKLELLFSESIDYIECGTECWRVSVCGAGTAMYTGEAAKRGALPFITHTHMQHAAVSAKRIRQHRSNGRGIKRWRRKVQVGQRCWIRVRLELESNRTTDKRRTIWLVSLRRNDRTK